jgi:hypothetical protein
MKPYLTVIREALRDRLLEEESIRNRVGKIYINRFESFDEREMTAMGIYLTESEPIENDNHPKSIEIRAAFTMEVLTRAKNSEELLDWLDVLIKQALTLDALGEIIKQAGRKDLLLLIEWLGSDLLYLVRAEETINVLVMNWNIEFKQPEPVVDLDPFYTAETSWAAKSPEGVVIEAENEAEMER